MSPMPSLGPREQSLLLDIVSALGASFNLQDILNNSYGPLLKLVSADYGALAVSGAARAEHYEWIVAGLPEQFFGGYEEMASSDFVRASAVSRPDVVLRDFEMIERRELERNLLYNRARELGAPLEQVMAVMLHVGQSWQSGVALYRERKRPFSDRESAILQHLVPAIRNTVSNCRTFSRIARRGALFESLLSDQEVASLIVTTGGVIIERTTAAEAMLTRWFAPMELAATTLPRPLLDSLSRLTCGSSQQGGDPSVWVRPGPEADLKVRFLPLPTPERLWALLLRELPHMRPVPDGWRKRLSPKEQKVASEVLCGSSNAEIAERLDCSEATVKTHVHRIFIKVGVESRAALLYRAERER